MSKSSGKKNRASAPEKKSSFLFDRAESLALLITVACLVAVKNHIPSVEVTETSVKRFASLEEFYPYYLQEHSDQTCKRLHFVGTSLIALIVLANPRLLFAGAAAASVGMVLFPLTFDVPHGAFEGAGMLLTAVTLSYLITRRWTIALGVPIIGYAFAWVGHFFFELNKPATFVYPFFSLASDFHMWYDMAVGNLPL